jgi:predicted nucleotidyltransferase
LEVNFLRRTAMPLEQLLLEKRAEITEIAARHGVERILVFGSAARGESRPDSDLDLLITTGPRISPWFPAGLIVDLEALLHRRVQVVTEAGLRPELRESVLRDARPL